MSQKKEFRIPFIKIWNAGIPLKSMAVAHLFYGVPFRMNGYYADYGTMECVFFEDK